MTLIAVTDVNLVVFRDGKVGTEAACLCRCCNCSECECEVELTYGGITFPADGLERTLCIYNDGEPGPFGLQSVNLWNRGPFGGLNFGMSGMTSVAAILECCPDVDFGPPCTANQFRVRVLTRYSQITGIGNVQADAYPEVGELCGNWIANALGFTSFVKTRIFQWPSCDDCGCPTNKQPERVDDFDYSLEDGPNVPCIDEYNEQTRTTPVFDIDCGPCE